MGKYIRKDCDTGFLTDSTEISYFKQIQEIEIINNFMIGDYNDKGEYITTKDILKELLDMPKFITKTFNSNMYLQSNCELNKFAQIKFLITVEDGVPKENYSRASLLLIEEISKCCGMYINTNSVVLDTFDGKNDETFNDKMFAKFNVVDQGRSTAGKSEVPLNILNRKTMLLEKNQKLFEDIAPICKEYFENRIKAYEKYAMGQEILEEFNSRQLELKKKCSVNDEKYFYYQNELLDLILHENSYEKNKEFRKAVIESETLFVKSCKNIFK